MTSPNIPTGKMNRKRRIITIAIGALVMAMMAPFAAISPVNAKGGEGKAEVYSAGDVTWDLSGSGYNKTTAAKKTQTYPGSGKPKPPVRIPTPDIVVTSSPHFFNQGGATCVPGEGGTVCYNFADAPTIGNCTAYPPADANFGYDGNAIPLPPKGAKGESRLVSFTIDVERIEIKDVTGYLEQDPKNPDAWIEVEGNGVDEETWYEYKYNWKCGYATAPEVSVAKCATWVQAQLNGPYDQSMNPMKSVLEPGGTNTRIPNPEKPNQYGVIGQIFEEPSELGKVMQKGGIDPKSGAPTLKIMQTDCIPHANDEFDFRAIDKSSTLGRYAIPSITWYTFGQYYHFTTPNTARIFPQAVKDSRYKDGYLITNITNAAPNQKLTSYFKLKCLSGTDTNGLVAKYFVGAGTAREWRVLEWGDSASNYYTWNCGDNPPGQNDVRTNDFLQCDTYGQRATAPYQYDRLDYTYSTNTYDVYGYVTRTQFRDRGADFINGEWIGRPCNPGEYDAGHNCAVDYQNWERIGSDTSTVKNPTPAGFEDNGSYWYKKGAPPAGWIDNGQEFETTTYSNIVVDHKNAAPIKGVAQLVGNPVTGNIEALPVEIVNGVYQLSSAADPIHVEWQKVRINTRDGRDINEAGKNVYWEYEYRLAPWSSPMLRNTDANASTQPYHGWVDTTNSTSPSAMPLNRKWEPESNYSFSTIPYSYSYLPYTYSEAKEYKDYTYSSPRQVWVKTGDGGCRCNPTNWAGDCVYGGTMHDGCCLDCWEDGYWATVYDQKDPPPPGWTDNGSRYERSSSARDATPAGYEDWQGQWRILNEAPAGWHDNGSGYTSDDPLNDGYTGGIAFNKFRTWPTYAGLKDCVVDAADYNDQESSKRTIKCGDNVTDRTRSAYFRYFMSSTAGSNGWQVTPWWRVTADIQTNYRAINRVLPDSEGDADADSDEYTGKWLRQSYECPGQPFRVNITRVAQN